MSYRTKAERFILTTLFGRTAEGAVPSTWYIGALDANELEPVDDDYTRVALSNVPGSFTSFVTAEGRTTTRVADGVAFPAASVNWSPVTALGFFDAPTDGDLWFVAPLNVAVNIEVTQALSFNPQTITFRQS